MIDLLLAGAVYMQQNDSPYLFRRRTPMAYFDVVPQQM